MNSGTCLRPGMHLKRISPRLPLKRMYVPRDRVTGYDYSSGSRYIQSTSFRRLSYYLYLWVCVDSNLSILDTYGLL